MTEAGLKQNFESLKNGYMCPGCSNRAQAELSKKIAEIKPRSGFEMLPGVKFPKVYQQFYDKGAKDMEAVWKEIILKALDSESDYDKEGREAYEESCAEEGVKK